MGAEAPAHTLASFYLALEQGQRIADTNRAAVEQASKLSRVEGTQRGIIVRDVRRLLNLYGITGETQREALFEMSRQSKQRG